MMDDPHWFPPVRLPCTRLSRSEHAWELVLFHGMSKADTADRAGVSERTVANMRRVKNALGDGASSHFWFDVSHMVTELRGTR